MRKKKSSKSRKRTPSIPQTNGPPLELRVSKTLEELAAEQGVRPIEHLEEILGRGADLWRTEAEWEAFLANLRKSRRKGA